MAKPISIVVGVGARRGLGAAICRRLAIAGHHVIAAGRTAAKLDDVIGDIRAAGDSGDRYLLEATSETDVVSLFAYAGRIGPSGPALVVFNVGINADMPILDVSAELFAHFWRTNCLAGFLVGREAARSMLPWGEGTIMFTGASASMRGAACFGHAAAAKAGLRMVSQSMAREFGPLGLHVAHVVIDGAMDGERVREAFPGKAEMRGPEGLLDVEAVAETYLQLHLQDRSAWTHELDLRPFTEDW